MAPNDLPLSEYVPESELKTEKHLISRPAFPVFDFHAHFGELLLGENYAEKYDTAEVVEKLRNFGVAHIVNLDGFSGKKLDKMLKKTEPFHDFIFTFGNVDLSRLDDPDFESYVGRTLRESKEKGIRGLKFWKNISLVLKDKAGKHIPVDDDRLDVIWQTAAELNLPVLIHIADPVAFFKPVTKKNERYEELSAHPDWSFCSPELFRFEELMRMQENLLSKNPNTTFVIAHVGSHAEDLGKVSEQLDRHSNMYLDIAERIAELGRQPYTAKKFFRKYSDRILFGTDSTPLFCENYGIYYRFLETEDEYFDYSVLPTPPQGRWKIYGIGLDRTILQKIYTKNAEKLLLK